MADQKINALPTKTTPTSGDKCLMSGAAEEYLIDYDKLATAILNKLTSKTFTLDQGTKTLIAAVNELNSNTLLTAKSISKPSNIDGAEIELWSVTARRIGRVAYIQFNIQGTITKYKTVIPLCTIPEEMAPTSTVIHNYITQNGEPMLLNIYTNGDVQLYANTESGIEKISFLRQSIAFVCVGD